MGIFTLIGLIVVVMWLIGMLGGFAVGILKFAILVGLIIIILDYATGVRYRIW